MNAKFARIMYWREGALCWSRDALLAAPLPGERIRAVLMEGAALYASRHGAGDLFAWVCDLPQGAQDGVFVPFAEGEVCLCLADWAPHGYIVLDRGGGRPRADVFSNKNGFEVLYGESDETLPVPQ